MRVFPVAQKRLRVARKTVEDTIRELRTVGLSVCLLSWLTSFTDSKSCQAYHLFYSCREKVGQIPENEMRMLSDQQWDSFHTKDLSHIDQCLACQCYYNAGVVEENMNSRPIVEDPDKESAWSSDRPWQCAEAVLFSLFLAGLQEVFCQQCLQPALPTRTV